MSLTCSRHDLLRDIYLFKCPPLERSVDKNNEAKGGMGGIKMTVITQPCRSRFLSARAIASNTLN